jgi:hypothetical protein
MIVQIWSENRRKRVREKPQGVSGAGEKADGSLCIQSVRFSCVGELLHDWGMILMLPILQVPRWLLHPRWAAPRRLKIKLPKKAA